jgi:hypothetical protein
VNVALKTAPPTWVRAIVTEVRAWCVETFARADRIVELENEVAALKRKSVAAPDVVTLADCHVGVHRPGLEAKRGQLCTHHGGCWLCLNDTAGTPGESPDWKLIVKAGRPGRDAKEAR